MLLRSWRRLTIFTSWTKAYERKFIRPSVHISNFRADKWVHIKSQCLIPQKCETSAKVQIISKQHLATVPKLRTMKLDCKEFWAIFTPELKFLISLFEKYGYELRIAGGAARDILMGKTPHDVDFATTATPAEMKELFEKEKIRMLNTKGEKHGTITCRINDKENFEVTTLRIDVVTDGRHAEVEFTKDWKLDALRRDLTVNSLFLGFDGTLYDYFNGQEDLANKRVVFVGSAADRIQEDYLRILRYFRFYGRIAAHSDGHDGPTLDAIRANMQGLSGISGERIWVELKKIVTGNFAADLMQVMLDLGIAPHIGLPLDGCNIEEMKKRCQITEGLSPLPMTLLSALLQTEDQINILNSRIKLSREEVRLGVFLIKHRGDVPGDNIVKYCKELQCDTAAKEPKAKERICELLKYWGCKDALNEYSQWTFPKFPVSGVRLLERGVQKGPALAKTLCALRQEWKKSGFVYTEEDLMEFVDELKESIK